jgi:hypothetical protein
MGDSWRPPGPHPRWGADDVIQSRTSRPQCSPATCASCAWHSAHALVVRDHLESNKVLDPNVSRARFGYGS